MGIGIPLWTYFWNTLDYHWKWHSTVSAPGEIRCVLLHYESWRLCTCCLNKFMDAFKFVKVLFETSCISDYYLVCSILVAKPFPAIVRIQALMRMRRPTCRDPCDDLHCYCQKTEFHAHASAYLSWCMWRPTLLLSEERLSCACAGLPVVMHVTICIAIVRREALMRMRRPTCRDACDDLHCHCQKTDSLHVWAIPGLAGALFYAASGGSSSATRATVSN
jgi:hypothetical protein